MPWNWELPTWPQFTYDANLIADKERQFLLGAGSSFAFLKNISESEYQQFVVEILSAEGLESSRIEGEILDRESLQSSIRQHFGMHPQRKAEAKKEAGMAKLLYSVYESYSQPLSQDLLFHWHSKLFDDTLHSIDIGQYRSHAEPMQIISRRYDSPKIFFEAPPSRDVPQEMKEYIRWYNATPSMPILGKAAIAHVYFESIHPFEDGNGRIGRIIVEKVLSQGVGKPVLIAVSKILEKRKKEYYAALEKCNKTLKVDAWVDFFADAVLQAQEESMKMLYFLIEKAKLFAKYAGEINERQEKALIRMFAEGPGGFRGGLSADNYLAITKTSRATATRDLADLVQKGILLKTGELRHTRYWLNLQVKG